MNLLQDKRHEAGLSQSELAKAAGINTQVLQSYEQGRRPINGARAITVYRIAQALGCTVEDLLEK